MLYQVAKIQFQAFFLWAAKFSRSPLWCCCSDVWWKFLFIKWLEERERKKEKNPKNQKKMIVLIVFSVFIFTTRKPTMKQAWAKKPAFNNNCSSSGGFAWLLFTHLSTIQSISLHYYGWCSLLHPACRTSYRMPPRITPRKSSFRTKSEKKKNL